MMRHEELLAETSPLPHPVFHLIPGGMADWEKRAVGLAEELTEWQTYPSISFA